MDALTSYQMLGRLLAYLEMSGAGADSGAFDNALALLSNEHAGDDQRVAFEMLISRIPDYYPVPTVDIPPVAPPVQRGSIDRKSTRLNSSHVRISYAVFCL